MNLKIKWLRFQVKYHQKLEKWTTKPKPILNEYQSKAIDIVVHYLKLKDNILLMSPKGKRYIQDGDIFVKMEKSGDNHKISISNHIENYDIPIPEVYYDDVKDIFDKEIERRRRLMEFEIYKNITANVSKLLTNVVKRIEEKEKNK